MEITSTPTRKMSLTGECIQAIQDRVNKYITTPEDEQRLEDRVREELRKQGYTRF